MSKFCCITDLIWFMLKEADKLMEGSVHEDNLFIIHDVLVLMTEKETIAWIIEKNYFHRWLLCMNGFQDGTPYVGRPVNNSPKFTPSDHSINRDILHIFHFHCDLRHFVLDEDGTNEDERNMHFSFSTPKEIARRLKRIRESKMGTPSSEKIIEDLDMALKSL